VGKRKEAMFPKTFTFVGEKGKSKRHTLFGTLVAQMEDWQAAGQGTPSAAKLAARRRMHITGARNGNRSQIAVAMAATRFRIAHGRRTRESIGSIQRAVPEPNRPAVARLRYESQQAQRPLASVLSSLSSAPSWLSDWARGLRPPPMSPPGTDRVASGSGSADEGHASSHSQPGSSACAIQ
jgi:hypothetical protein